MNNQYTEEDYKWLAQFGRMGDNQIREIDGEPQHVNTYEAYLIDHYGKEGEAAVDLMGSGTTNPYTGMPEYNPKLSTPSSNIADNFGISLSQYCLELLERLLLAMDLKMIGIIVVPTLGIYGTIL